MSERPDDRDLDEFIAGRSELSRRYRDAVGRDGAPPELDHAVLERAQQAIEYGRRAKRRTLVVPLALAATVVLSFSVFMVMRDQPGGLPPPAPMPEAKISQDVPAQPRADAARNESRLQSDAAPEAESLRRLSEPAAPPAPASAPAPAQFAPAQQELDAQAARKTQKAEQGVGAAAGLSADRASPPAEMRERRAAKAPARSMLDQASAQQAWLARVRQIKERGDLAEARRELENFQRAHPDHAIPDDLRSLLRPVTPPTP